MKSDKAENLENPLNVMILQLMTSTMFLGSLIKLFVKPMR